MKKFVYDLLYINNEISQERYSIFVALHYGIIIGIISLVLYLFGYITDIKELLNYSSTIILAALGFKVGASILRDTNSQIFGSPKGQMPERIRKNREGED